MTRRASSGFSTVRSEGGLLSSGLLQRISSQALEDITPASYHLAEGETLKDRISRSWARALGLWSSFHQNLERLAAGDPATTVTRERWLLPLLEELGYGRLQTSRTLHVDSLDYPISHAWGQLPVHLVGARVDLDHRTRGVPGASSTSPHSLVQDLLNRSDAHLWGVVSNGFVLRLLRDHTSLTRQALVEFDLEAMLNEEQYPDFALLWLVCHQSRFEGARPEEFIIERWSREGVQLGIRALDHLRDGVQKAIEALGSGFLATPGNSQLKDSLRTGALDKQDYYRELLRLVYRLILLFVAEDRDLLHTPTAGPEARARYRDFYSTARLRELARTIRGGRHGDLWEMLLHVFRLLSDSGAESLGLTPLGGFLWSTNACQSLDRSSLANANLLEAIRAISFVQEGRILLASDWRNLGSEELGSVYESLLELHPDVNSDAARFELHTAAGHERKTTGSYYTPSSLIQCLLDSALEPIIARAAKEQDPAKALLSLRVCDPACGSGHFLVAASHRIARRLAAIRTSEGEPAPTAVRAALRDVVGHCVYGVDLNPMAAELCRVSLWLEALEPGKPLSFLDHHIRVGNSLLGATPALMVAGLPDETFTAIEGDDKRACSKLKKLNKRQREDSLPLLAQQDAETQIRLQRAAAAVEGIRDDRLEDIRAKEVAFRKHEDTQEYRQKLQLADAWCAAFVIKKHFRELAGVATASAITQGSLNDLANGRSLSATLVAEIKRLSGEYQFFHWHLAFPEVFATGGFDCVLGNPPWEHTELKEKEWFAERSPSIANARIGFDRKRMIAALQTTDPPLYAAFVGARRRHDGLSHFFGNSGRYPFCGRGRINLYAVFAETMRTLINELGRAGCVLPTGIATDDTTKLFFRDMVTTKSLVSLFDFENRLGLFPAVDSRIKFCLFTAGRGMRPITESADFVFFAHSVEALRDPERRFTLSAEDIALINPNTRTCPIFRSRADADLTKAIYRRVPVLLREAQDGGMELNAWGIRIRRLFNMGLPEVSVLARSIDQLSGNSDGDSRVTSTSACHEQFVPMLEGKMFDAFNHRAAGVIFNPSNAIRGAQPIECTASDLADPTFSPRALYWFPSSKLDGIDTSQFAGRWHLGFKDVSAVTNERSMIAAILPADATNFSVRVVQFVHQTEADSGSVLLGILNSYAFDYVLRQSLGGLHVSDYITHQVPVITPMMLVDSSAWTKDGSLRAWLVRRVLELSYTAWDLNPFAQDCGWSGPPFRWDEGRRFLIRCELDAAVFHLYLPAEANGSWRPVEHESEEGRTRFKQTFPTPRDAVAYIMDTFPIVRRKDEETHGEYRTKRVILEIYDAMQEGNRTGQPYVTRLSPPPADPRCCHPPRVYG